MRGPGCILTAGVFLLVAAAAAAADGVEGSDNIECRRLHDVNATSRCQFIQSVPSCRLDEGQINYIHFIYCDVSPPLQPLAVVLLMPWLLVCFLMLALTADEYFYTTLTTLAHLLHMNENIAGVTVLAFGNGAPDIFTAIIAVTGAKNGDLGLALGALLGAATFVTTVVAASIVLTRPFHMKQRPFLRDTVFYLVATFWVFLLLWRGHVTVADALGFIGLYFAYVVVVIVGKYVNTRMKGQREREQVVTVSGAVSVQREGPGSEGSEGDSEGGYDSDMLYNRRTLIEQQHPPHYHHHEHAAANGDRDTYCLSDQHLADVRVTTTVSCAAVMRQYVKELAVNINPVSARFIESDEVRIPEPEMVDFSDEVDGVAVKLRWYHKVGLVIKAPLRFVLILTTPVIDNSADDLGWCKPLALWHVLATPQFCMWAAGLSTASITVSERFSLPAPVIPLVFSILLSIVIAKYSSVERPVRLYRAFSLLGFTSSVLWIYMTVNEIVNMLHTLGVVFNVSTAVLGVTVLAWANSLGDLVTDVVTARNGKPVMAASAAFGGTLFNVLLGVGLPFTVLTLRHGTYHIARSLVNYILVAGLGASLLSSFLVIPVGGFRVYRAYGCYLIGLYTVFIVLTLLAEVGVIS